MKPTDVLRHVLDGLSYQELDVMPAEFHCGCNRERATRVVLALGRDELEDMISRTSPPTCTATSAASTTTSNRTSCATCCDEVPCQSHK